MNKSIRNPWIDARNGNFAAYITIPDEMVEILRAEYRGTL